MVKKIVLLLVSIISLSTLVTCGFFFLTPFPYDLIFFEDSVPVDDIAPFHYTRLYVLGDYVFLYVDEQDNDDKLYIFTEDLEQVFVDSMSDMCDTFAMEESEKADASEYYYIGTRRYLFDGDDVEVSSLINLNFPEIEGTPPPGPPPSYPINFEYPPYGFGFSDGNMSSPNDPPYNYRVGWSDGIRALQYVQYSSGWGYNYHDTVILLDYDDLEALYYHEDPEDYTKSKVVLFFNIDDDESGGIEVVTIPVQEFKYNLSEKYQFPEYFNEITTRIPDINPEYCYYTGNGFVFREHDGTSLRYNIKGEFKKKLIAVESDYSEAYSLDGKTRYIFSETYLRLMKTEVWW